MATTINVRYLLKLVFVSTPVETAAMNNAPSVDRPVSGRGGFINRLIAAKLAPFKSSSGQSWPAFAGRLDPIRLKGQKALEEQLSHIELLLQRISGEIIDLAAFVRGSEMTKPIGITVQQALGRLFFPDYCASAESYDAAVTLSAWLSGGPLKSLYLGLSGKFHGALQEVTERARGNVYCSHATGLALHNIVESMSAMRQLARSGDNLTRLLPSEAAAQTLRAPKRIVREARDATTALGYWVSGRSLALIDVEAVRQKSTDPASAFFTGDWNQCPAHAFIPALLAQVWQIAGKVR